MKSAIDELPITRDDSHGIARKLEWGGMTISAGEVRQAFDGAPKYKGLPGDACQLSHWGYILEGQFRCKFGDKEEVYSAGDLFYLPPGHTPVYEAGCVYIAFTPADEAARKQAELLQANERVTPD